MMRYRRLLLAILVLAVGFAAASVRLRVRAADERLPQRLTDAEFWRLTEELSEPDGYFRSDNLLLSNFEIYFRYRHPGAGPADAARRGVHGRRARAELHVHHGAQAEAGVHYGYPARQHAYAVDVNGAVRALRGPHRVRVAPLRQKTPGAPHLEIHSRGDLHGVCGTVDPGAEEVYNTNLKAIDELLEKKHGLALSSDDLSGVNYVYHNFYSFGPNINYNSSARGGGFGGFVSYADLMVATDADNVNRSFLANEESFRVVKDLEQKDLIVPLVGDFAGPKAIRAIGKYLKEHNATVTAFYASNVEQFLYGSGTWTTFCRNVASLPLDATSTFIRSTRSGGFGRGAMSVLGSMKSETENCASATRFKRRCQGPRADRPEMLRGRVHLPAGWPARPRRLLVINRPKGAFLQVVD